MLFKYIFTSLVCVTSALTAPYAPQEDTPALIYVRDDVFGPKISPDIPSQQANQIRQAHFDAVDLCWVMINSAQQTDQFDRIFKKYFGMKDRQMVITPPTATLSCTKSPSCPTSPPTPTPKPPKSSCSDRATYAALHDGTTSSPSLILCPKALAHSSPAAAWPNVPAVTCDSIGSRVSWRMLTLGHVLVHQYTLFKDLGMTSDLKEYDGVTEDLANGPIEVLGLPRYKSRMNGDSYAWFMTELAWTPRCGREFAEPVKGDDQDPY